MSDQPTTVAIICQTLIDRIAAGEFSVEGKLPSERTLSEFFATTRITLREALGQLESQGLIYRELRRGWFLSPPRIVYNPLQRSHFHAMAEEQGREAHTELIDAVLITASAKICQQMSLCAGTEVYRIRRLRRIDGRAVLYVEHYLNPRYFPGILEDDLTQSLTDLYLSRYGIRYGRVRFEMLPTILSVSASKVLKIAQGSPALFITRINRDRDDRIIDCDYEYWRYDALHINVEAQ